MISSNWPLASDVTGSLKLGSPYTLINSSTTDHLSQAVAAFKYWCASPAVSNVLYFSTSLASLIADLNNPANSSSASAKNFSSSASNLAFNSSIWSAIWAIFSLSASTEA